MPAAPGSPWDLIVASLPQVCAFASAGVKFSICWRVGYVAVWDTNDQP